jgi:hypothetical protein
MYETEKDVLAGLVELSDLSSAVDFFKDPSLARSDRLALYNATRDSLFLNFENKNQATIDEYLAVLEFMTHSIDIDVASRSNSYLPDEKAAMVEKVIEIGPQVTAELFAHPLLATNQRQELYEAAKVAFWESYEEDPSMQWSQHLFMLSDMEAALNKSEVEAVMAEPEIIPVQEAPRDPYADARLTGRIAINLMRMPKDLVHA